MHVECIVRLRAALPVRCWCASVYVRARIRATGRSKIPGSPTIEIVEPIAELTYSSTNFFVHEAAEKYRDRLRREG